MGARSAEKRYAKFAFSALGPDKVAGDIAMVAVLFGQGEVLVIVIITAVVVLLIVRGRKK